MLCCYVNEGGTKRIVEKVGSRVNELQTIAAILFDISVTGME